MKSIFRIPVLLSVLALSMQACLDSPDTPNADKQMAEDVATIDSYLSSHNIDAIKDVSGIRMEITDLGTGLVPYYKSTVTVAYVGTVLGQIVPFESSTTSGKISSYIAGWQFALTSLPVGSKATIYIPSPLAYGTVAKPQIPANSILVFEVFLKEMASTTTEANQFKADTTAIETYLADKEIVDYVKDPSGIRFVKTVEVPGPALMPELYTKVKFSLVLKKLSEDTKELISITREPNEGFNGRVIDNIRALSILLPQMKEGEKATVYIPSYLGFTTDPITDTAGVVLVPPNTPVIMEIELLDIIE
jgi:FKBP-type peptidyl-prolyl cis-trans isomerase